MDGEKRIFLLVETDATVLAKLEAFIKEAYDPCLVYTAQDGSEGNRKLFNDPPHILVTNIELPKRSGTDLVQGALLKFPNTNIIIISDIPEHEEFNEGVQNGRIRFLSSTFSKNQFLDIINNSLMTLESKKRGNEFKTILISPGDFLFKEGEEAKSAFLVRRGRLRATKRSDGQTRTLGEIIPGEFVGEMAYINQESRSANVEAIETTELIEIPVGTLDILLFSKPVWARALMKSLARRLKDANQRIFL